MIDLNLLKLVDATMPRLNYDLCNGLAAKQVNEEVEAYMNDIIRSAAESFPPGLKYVSCKRCTPLEQFKEISRPPTPKRGFDLSRSDVYLMKYMFTLHGVDLRPQYIFLPFVNDGGLMYLMGTLYKITPVIGGRIYNVEKGCIYMPTPKARMGFHKREISVMLNNHVVNTVCICTSLFNIKKEEARSKLNSTLMHYILAEYGLTVAMSKLFKSDIMVGHAELDNLPMSEWMVYRSKQIFSSARKAGNIPVTDIRIAVPVSQYTKGLDGIIGTVFYIIDNSSESITLNDLDNPQIWLLVLDRFIFNTIRTEKSQYEKMQSHHALISRIIDPITKRILAQDNIFCENIFDLFAYMIVNFQDIIIHNDVGSMYNQELTTVKHLMYHVVYNIFIVMYALHKMPPELITVEKVNKIFTTQLRRNKIFTVSGHGELTAESIATDCKIYSATCNIISYSKAIGAAGAKRKKKTYIDGTLLLHPSQCEVGTYLMMTKADCTGRSKANPFMYFSRKWIIAPRPELKPLIANLTELLSKRSN